MRLTKLSEADDVEAYLTTFERMMTAFEVQKERWVFKLAPYLTGKEQQAYAAMAAEDAGEYEYLKAAILKRYNINEETYRVRFRAVARKPEEGYIRGNGNKGNGLVAEVDERAHIHGGSHGGGGSRADAQLTPS